MNDRTISDVRIGDRVRWESAAGILRAGILRGEVVDISLGLNAKGDLIPWITIEHIVNNRPVRARLCGTHGYLKMMKFTVMFRDAVRPDRLHDRDNNFGNMETV